MVKIFIDFDGTITAQDVGDAMFLTFGGPTATGYIADYRSGSLSAQKCFELECEACRGTLKSELDRFLDRQMIDGSFVDFHRFCSARGIPHFILSDGMDYYIERILENNGLSDLPFHSNHLDLTPSGDGVVFNPSFPFSDAECDRCACCKRNIILSLTADDDIIVYVGEGFSDRCPVKYADIVFAKDDLLNYCRQENISYYEYGSFSDVRARLEGLFSQKETKNNFGLKKRRQAQLAAHDLYLGG